VQQSIIIIIIITINITIIPPKNAKSEQKDFHFTAFQCSEKISSYRFTIVFVIILIIIIIIVPKYMLSYYI